MNGSTFALFRLALFSPPLNSQKSGVHVSTKYGELRVEKEEEEEEEEGEEE